MSLPGEKDLIRGRDEDEWRPLRPAFCKLLDFPEHYSWEAIYEEMKRRLSQVSPSEGTVDLNETPRWKSVSRQSAHGRDLRNLVVFAFDSDVDALKFLTFMRDETKQIDNQTRVARDD